MARYRKEIPAYARHSPYQPTVKFDNDSDYLISATQGAIQDVFDLAEDIIGIRKTQVQCAFLTAPNTPGETRQEFIALVWYNPKHVCPSWIPPIPPLYNLVLKSDVAQQAPFKQSLRHLLNQDGFLGFAFQPPPKEGEKDVAWDAYQIPRSEWKYKWRKAKCDLARKIRQPSKPRKAAFAINNMPFEAYDDFDKDNKS